MSVETLSEDVCDECVVAGQNVFLGLIIHLPRLEYYFEPHHSYSANVVCYSFSKDAVIRMHSSSFEIDVTLVAFRPKDAFIDITANSILRVIILSVAVKIAFSILSPTVSPMLANAYQSFP